MKAGQRKLSDVVQKGNWLTTVPLVVVGLAYLYFWFLPNRRELDDLRRELRNQREIATQDATVRLELDKTKEKMSAAQQYVRDWEEVAPNGEECSFLFASINEMLTAAGCRTTSFLPRPQLSLTHLRKIPVSIELQSDLAGLFQALESIEQMPTTVWIETLAIERPENQDLLRSEASLVIFSENSSSSD